MYSDEDLLALSGLQHAAFCERQWALIHVEQIWSESSDTVRGDFFHERVDTTGYSCARGVRSERRVRVVSHRLGLYGVADIVEYRDDGCSAFTPVEYKVGRPKVEDWDRLQVAAQALCLEEMEGARVAAGALFYGETRRRETVEITDELRERVERLSAHIHELYEKWTTPKPPPGARCGRCSLRDDCLPTASGLDAREYWETYEAGFGG